MPERGFDTGFWTEGFVQKLPERGKHLLIYLGTNAHCNQAGLYYLTPDTIAFETGIPAAEIAALIKMLEPRILWWPEEDLIWVKDFVRSQTKSPKFLAAVAKSLVAVPNKEAVRLLLKFNEESHTISIPYQYYTDKVSIPYPYHTDTVSILTRASASASGPDPVSDSGDDVAEKGVGKGEKQRLPSESEDDESLLEGDREVISLLRSVKGFNLDEGSVRELVARMRTEFHEEDMLAELKKWTVRKMSEPLLPTSRVSSQIWGWMEHARTFRLNRRRPRDKAGGRDYDNQRYSDCIVR